MEHGGIGDLCPLRCKLQVEDWHVGVKHCSSVSTHSVRFSVIVGPSPLLSGRRQAVHTLFSVGCVSVHFSTSYNNLYKTLGSLAI